MAVKIRLKQISTMVSQKLCLFLIIQSMTSSFIQGMLETQSRAMPIQMDMSSEGDVTICTGLKRYIACRDGSNIAVTNAFWGRISDKVCPSDDGDPVTDCEGSDETLPLVKKYCEGKNECKLEAKHSLLQNNGTHHCPGVNKYLIVNYTCIPESKGVTLCDSAETTLSCKAGWVMELADIFWGRRSSSKYCGTEEGMECDSSEGAGRYLKNQCNGKKKCLIKADANILDTKSSSCSGMLKYLMVNYICKPPKESDKDDKAEKEDDDDDNKILQDTSSKELMGLLEKHLNEIKTPDTQTAPQNNKETTAKVEEKNKGLEAKQYQAPVKPVAKSTGKTSSKTRATVGRNSNTPFVATEEDEITNTLLNGPAFTRTIKKADVPSNNVASKNMKKTDNAQRKDEVETPKEAKTTEQQITSKTANTAKDTVPKATETKEDESYEVTEPNTVRSILQRAKEVLKTLDTDTSSDEINKRGNVAHLNKKGDFEKETTKAVKEVSKLAQSLVNTAATKAIKGGNKQQKKSTRVEQAATGLSGKPKPGAKKTGYRGTGTAGIGNTP